MAKYAIFFERYIGFTVRVKDDCGNVTVVSHVATFDDGMRVIAGRTGEPVGAEVMSVVDSERWQ